MKVTVETFFRVSEDPIFYYEISEDGDGLGLVSFSYKEKERNTTITMTPQAAKAIAEKMIEMAKILEEKQINP